MPAGLAHEIYEHTLGAGHSWGTYVTLAEAQGADGEGWSREKQLAAQLVRALWREAPYPYPYP